MHLVHELAAVSLYCRFYRSQFGGYLLIEPSGDHPLRARSASEVLVKRFPAAPV
jgi:hypothetical protein